jgi:hypothetical protein
VIGAGVLGLGGPPGPSVLRDDFVGSIQPRIWPTRTDVGGNLSVSAGRLAVAGGTGTWADTALVQRSVARASFGGIVASVRISGSSGTGLLAGYAASAAPSYPTGVAGAYFDSSSGVPSWKVGAAAQLVTKPSTRVRAIDYQIAAIPRVGGGYWLLLSGGVYGAWPTGTLVWVDDTEAADPVYPLLANKSGALLSDFYQVLRPGQVPAGFLSRYGPAASADTFTRANGSLSGSALEVGGTWTVDQGVFNVASGVAARSGAGRCTARTDTGQTDKWTIVTVRTPSSGSINAVLHFRYQDANNKIFWWIDTSGFHVGKTIGGAFTSIYGTGSWVAANSKTYRILTREWAGLLQVWVIDGSSVTDVTFGTPVSVTGVLSTETKSAIEVADSGSDNGSTFDDYQAYALTQTLPSSVRVPRPPAASGAALITDTFTGTDATLLTAHSPDSGGGAWQANSGSFEINTNRARLTSAGAAGVVTQDAGVVDHYVEAIVTAPANPAVNKDWECGVVGRFVDTNNYLVPRYLFQSNSPEIELWQVLGGSGGLKAFVNLGAGNLVQNVARTLGLAVVGAEAGVYLDGELVSQGTTSLTGTRAGIGVYGSEPDGRPTWDTLTVKAATGG